MKVFHPSLITMTLLLLLASCGGSARTVTRGRPSTHSPGRPDKQRPVVIVAEAPAPPSPRRAAPLPLPPAPTPTVTLPKMYITTQGGAQVVDKT